MNCDFAEKIGFNYIKNKLECCSPYGAELAKKILPFSDKDRLFDELFNVKRAYEAVNTPEKTDRLMFLFMPLKDIRRSINELGEGAADEVSLFEIKRFLLQLEQIIPEYKKLELDFCNVNFEDCSSALSLLCVDENYNAGFFISDKYSQKLREIRTRKREIELEIRKSSSFEETAELKRKRLHIADEEAAEEVEVRRALSMQLLPYKEALLSNINCIGLIDLYIAKAKLALACGGVCPEFADDFSVSLKNMYNPYVIDSLSKLGRSFTPVTISARSGSTVITGANMGGKSVALKTLGLNVLAAMCGMFVFADEAKVPFITNFAMIAEDSEDMKNGLSSFGGEMVKLKEVLSFCDEASLILLDEPARGTNPQEGAKIVRALVKYLNDKKAICVFTTHYDGICSFARKNYRVIGLRDFDFNINANGLSSVECVAAAMNYGLYEADDASDCPKEALGICRLIFHDEPLLDILMSEN